MKGSELIAALKNFEDFDIETAISFPDGGSYGVSYNKSPLIGIGDIGYSSKTVQLEFDFKSTEDFIESLLNSRTHQLGQKKGRCPDGYSCNVAAAG